MVESRKRERKSVDRFKPDDVKETGRTVVQEGKGSKLADIPNVSFKLDKLKGTDETLEVLHQILFKSKGKALSRKRDIKSFSGLVYEGDEAEEAKKVESRVSKLTLPQIHNVMDLLDVPRGSDAKEKKIEKVVEFLQKPEVLSEKDLKAQAETKKTKAAAKRAKTSAKKEKAEAKSKAGSAKKTEKPASKGVTKVKGTPAKKGSAKKEAPAKATPAKKASAQKEKKPAASTRKRKADNVDTSAAKSPKKAKTATGSGWPSQKQLEKDVEAIVEEMTGGDGTIKVKAVYEAVGKKYGLSKEEVNSKKQTIRAMLNKLQASNAADAEEPQEDGTEAAAGAAEPAPDAEMVEPVDEPAPSEPPVAAAKAPVVEEPESEIAAEAENDLLEPTPELEVAQEAPTDTKQVEETYAPETLVQPNSVQEPSETSKPAVSAEEAPAAAPVSEVPTEGTGPSVPQGNEPVAEDLPLIQTPATMEGDELPVPAQPQPPSYIPQNPIVPNPYVQAQTQEAAFDVDSYLNL